jgi:glutathione peroxidase
LSYEKVIFNVLSVVAFFNSCAQKKSEESKAKTKELMGKSIYDFKVDALKKESRSTLQILKERKSLL